MAAKPLPQSELEELLNETVTSRDGMTFSPCEDRWRLTHTSTTAVNVSRAAMTFPPEVRPYFRLALARYARSYSPDTVMNITLSCYLIPEVESGVQNNWLDEACLLSAKGLLGSKREFQVANIRGFLRFWFESGLYGIDPNFMNSISEMRFKGAEKGTRVLTEDPINGPLTELEHRAVLDCATDAYMGSRISTRQMLIVKLFSELGLRRAQATQAFCSDFYERGGRFFFNQPRAKQRYTGWRGAFSEFRVTETLYTLVQVAKKEYFSEITKVHGAEVASKIDAMPLFPRIDNLASQAKQGAKIDASCCQIRKDIWYELTRTQRLIAAVSERTGEVINLTPQRFRYSLGSDMDREGRGVGVIAAALDHQDEQNAGVYVGMSDEMAHRLDAKIGPLLAPMAQAFAGVIVRSEQEAVRGNDPSSRIRTIDGSANAGTCGNFAYCGANAPISCYTCSKFHPWLDAPHEEVLADLYEEREEILRVTNDEAIASVNDRTILAVEQVVGRCNELNQARSKNV